VVKLAPRAGGLTSEEVDKRTLLVEKGAKSLGGTRRPDTIWTMVYISPKLATAAVLLVALCDGLYAFSPVPAPNLRAPARMRALHVVMAKAKSKKGAKKAPSTTKGFGAWLIFVVSVYALPVPALSALSLGARLQAPCRRASASKSY
jgi:hypothetical protein